MAVGPWGLQHIGPDIAEALFCISGPSTFAMSTLNNAWGVRFRARDSRDIKSVHTSWSSQSGVGVVACRIETIDTTSGKPTGTLYDANAAVSLTPAAGLTSFQFASLPTTGLVAGNEYFCLFITTTAATQVIRAYNAGTGANQAARYPLVAMTATDGSTRSNLAEVAGSIPMIVFQLEDDTFETYGCVPILNQTAPKIFGNNGIGQKFVLNTTIEAAGFWTYGLNKVGTPPANLRLQLFDNSGNVVSGATCTIDADSLTTATKGYFYPFNVPVLLPPGTYRGLFDVPGRDGDASNYFGVYRGSYYRSASGGEVPTAYQYTSSTDMTANPPTFVDVAGDISHLALMYDDVRLVGGPKQLLRATGQNLPVF